MQTHSRAQRRHQLGAARAMQIPDAPIPLTLGGPAADDPRMASLSASIDPIWGAPGLHAAQWSYAPTRLATKATTRCAAATSQRTALISALGSAAVSPRASVAPTALARLTACPARRASRTRRPCGESAASRPLRAKRHPL